MEVPFRKMQGFFQGLYLIFMKPINKSNLMKFDAPSSPFVANPPPSFEYSKI